MILSHGMRPRHTRFLLALALSLALTACSGQSRSGSLTPGLGGGGAPSIIGNGSDTFLGSYDPNAAKTGGFDPIGSGGTNGSTASTFGSASQAMQSAAQAFDPFPGATPAQQNSLQKAQSSFLDLGQALTTIARASSTQSWSDLIPAAQKFQAAWNTLPDLIRELREANLPSISLSLQRFYEKTPIWRFYRIVDDTRVPWKRTGRHVYHNDLAQAVTTLIPKKWQIEGTIFRLYKNPSTATNSYGYGIPASTAPDGCNVPVYECAINPANAKQYPETRYLLTNDTNCDTPANNSGLAPRAFWPSSTPLGYACNSAVNEHHKQLERFLGQKQNLLNGDILQAAFDSPPQFQLVNLWGYVLTRITFFVPLE